jgi:cytidylate kinase
MPSRPLIIAIDGPSGVGKGTVARAIARELGYRHLDTGAMYRAIGWKAERLGVPLDDAGQVAELAARLVLDLDDGRVVVDGEDATTAIRTPEIDRAATRVARLAGVRTVLVRRQRALGEAGGIVVEGRDIGTVVFPGADVKIFLDATPDERARRRAADPAHSGNADGIASVAVALEARDRSDRTRSVSPLVMAEDAVLVDTTGVSIEDVLRRVREVVRSRLPAPSDLTTDNGELRTEN